MEKKVRFRLHKVKKHWVTIAVSTAALALALAGGNSVQADEISVTATTVPVVETVVTDTTTATFGDQEVTNSSEADQALVVSENSSSETTSTDQASSPSDVTTRGETIKTETSDADKTSVDGTQTSDNTSANSSETQIGDSQAVAVDSSASDSNVQADETPRQQFVSDAQGNWYYYDANGQKVTGFQTIDQVPLYFDQNGVQAKGKLVAIDGASYYFDKDSGAMVVNQEINFPKNGNVDYPIYRYFGADGKMVTGWQERDGETYYYDENGYQVRDVNYYNNVVADRKIYNTGLFSDRAADYQFDAKTGAMIRNAFAQVDGYSPQAAGHKYPSKDWAYFGADGKAVSGWQTIDGKTYYFYPGYNLQARHVLRNIDGTYYYFDQDGVLVRNRFLYLDNTIGTYNTSTPIGDYPKPILDSWIYLDGDGKAVTGFYQLGDHTYYFKPDANYPVQAKGELLSIDGKSYYFDKDSGNLYRNQDFELNGKSYTADADGVVTEVSQYRNQFVSDAQGNWYYYSANGQKVTGPQTIDSFNLYFDENGVQIKGALVERDGKTYYYDKDNGRLVTNQTFEVNGKSYTADTDGVVTEAPEYHNQFVSDDQGNWYYYDAKGHKLTGFQTVDGVKLYFKEDGKQAKGELVTVDGNTYYFDKDSGALVVNQEINFGGYGPNKFYTAYRYFDADGRMVKGWLDRDGQRYYYDENGVKVLDVNVYNHNAARREFIPGLFGPTVDYQFDAKTGAMYRNAFARVYGHSREDPIGTRYPYAYMAYFGEDGKAVSGWQDIDGKTYYFYPESNFRTGVGLRTIDGKTYYFQPGTVSLFRNGTFEVDGKSYTADADGVVTEVPEYHNQFVSDAQGDWYYYDASGHKLTGFQTVDGVKLYFKEDGKQAKGELVTVDGKAYYFDPNSGELFTDGAKEINGQTYYFAKDGSLLRNQFYTVRVPGHGNDNDYTLYLDSDGQPYKNGFLTLEGKTYYFFPDSGHMATGRTLIDNVGYYFDQGTGELAKNQLVASKVTGTGPMYTIYYYLADENGRLQTGWRIVDGETYYFVPATADNLDSDYYRAASMVREIDGNYYLFDGEGKLKRNYIGKVSYSGQDAFGNVQYSSTYKTNAEGVLQKGLFEVNEEIYYFNYDGYTLASPSGQTKDPWQVIDGQLYHFKFIAPGYNMAPLSRNANAIKDGKMYHLDDNGQARLLDVRNQFISDENQNWYYFDADGNLVTGFQTINGQNLYFYKDGKQAKGVFVTIDGKTYYFDRDSGEKWVNRQLVSGPYTYVFDADGVATKVRQ